MATDDFNRADGPIGGGDGWANITPGAVTYGTNEIVIDGNVVHQDTSVGIAIWDDSFDDDQYAKATFGPTMPGDQGVGIGLRMFENGTPLLDAYDCTGTASYGVIRKFIAGVPTILANPGWSAASGDEIGGEAEGSDIRIYLNDVEEDAVSNGEVTSGAPGLSLIDFSAVGELDDWEGGNLFVPPLALPWLGLFDADLNPLALFDTDLAWTRLRGLSQVLVQYARDFQKYGRLFFRHRLLRMVGARELIEAMPRIGRALRGPLIHALKRSTRAWSCRKPNVRHGRGWHVKRCRDLWLAMDSYSPNFA
jgi:hypothetical protein